MKMLEIYPCDRILIVAPHPDDECIGAGGLMSLYSNQCDVFVLTDGAEGQRNMSQEETRKVRRLELLAEMEHIAIKDYVMFDIPDGRLSRHCHCLDEVNLSKYTKIFVTGNTDNNHDHTAALVCVNNAIDFQNIKNVEIYLYEVHNAFLEPTHMLNITSVVENKIKLIRFHNSQTNIIPYDIMALRLAEYRALQQRMRNSYIEVFKKVNLINEEYKEISPVEEKLQKFEMFYFILTEWLKCSIEKKCFSSFMKGKNVAIYGFAELGKLLFLQLKENDIKVTNIFDKNKCGIDFEDITIESPHYNPNVDIVVVTADFYFEEIEKNLKILGYDKILSLSSLLGNYIAQDKYIEDVV